VAFDAADEETSGILQNDSNKTKTINSATFFMAISFLNILTHKLG